MVVTSFYSCCRLVACHGHVLSITVFIFPLSFPVIVWPHYFYNEKKNGRSANNESESILRHVLISSTHSYYSDGPPNGSSRRKWRRHFPTLLLFLLLLLPHLIIAFDLTLAIFPPLSRLSIAFPLRSVRLFLLLLLLLLLLHGWGDGRLVPDIARRSVDEAQSLRPQHPDFLMFRRIPRHPSQTSQRRLLRLQGRIG